MGKPKPFSRPSISLDPGVKKDWQEVEAHMLVRGDTVRGYGTIDWIEWDDFGDSVTIRWVNGKTSLFAQFDVVTAFTEV